MNGTTGASVRLACIVVATVVFASISSASASDGRAIELLNSMAAAADSDEVAALERGYKIGTVDLPALRPAPSIMYSGIGQVWLGQICLKLSRSEEARAAYVRATAQLGQAIDETKGEEKGMCLGFLGQARRVLSEDWNSAVPEEERIESLAIAAIGHYQAAARMLSGTRRQTALQKSLEIVHRVMMHIDGRLDAGRLADADRACRKLLEVVPENDECDARLRAVQSELRHLLVTATNAVEAGDSGTAETTWQRLQTGWPGHPELPPLRVKIEAMRFGKEMDRAREHLGSGEFHSCFDICNLILAEDPAFVSARRLRAFALMGLGRVEEACSDAKLWLSPGSEAAADPELWMEWGLACFTANCLEEAVGVFDHMLRTFQDLPTSMAERATALRDECRRELATRPQSYEALRDRVIAGLDQGAVMQAAVDADLLVEHYADRPQSHCVAAIAYSYKDLPRALTEIEAALAHTSELLSALSAETYPHDTRARVEVVLPSLSWAIHDFSRRREPSAAFPVAVTGWLLLGDARRASKVCDTIDGREPWNRDGQLLALVHMCWGMAQHVAGVGDSVESQPDADWMNKSIRAHLTWACLNERDSIPAEAREITATIEKLMERLGLEVPAAW